ncbi:hypothetical protein LZ31DRAFT_154523 [Colletotrichum somersetense]|nr:hypothetical protein LZ31DRAFT_154523 [Colletotrichum somersetense]
MSQKPHSKGTNESSLWIWMTLYLYGLSARHLLTSRPRSQRRFQMAGAVAWTTSFLLHPRSDLRGPRGRNTILVKVRWQSRWELVILGFGAGGRLAVQSRAGLLSVFLGRESGEDVMLEEEEIQKWGRPRESCDTLGEHGDLVL